jgi:galactokinase
LQYALHPFFISRISVPDTAAYNNFPNTNMKLDFTQFFGYEPVVKTHAPGRIEFIGNHTDYNGGMVMGVAVDKGVTVEAAPRKDDKIRLTTTHGDTAIEIRVGNIARQTGSRVWANYILGVLAAMRDAGMKLENGLDLHVHSDLPSGAGLSSSAALELSVAWAAAKLYGFSTDKATLARIGRKAENEFVGMPCGILDQGVSAFGEKDAIVRIDCAKEEFSTIAMPKGLRFWVLNTNEKHNLVESLYATRHKECMEAYNLIKNAGSKAKNLAGATPEDLAKSNLPELLLKRARHVTEEHRRVIAMSGALQSGDKKAIGDLLYASHESSRSLFENTTEKLDTLVGIMKTTHGVVGARMTGGGFGGAAMALATSDFTEVQAREVCAAFEKHYPGTKLTVFSAAAGAGAGLC